MINYYIQNCREIIVQDIDHDRVNAQAHKTSSYDVHPIGYYYEDERLMTYITNALFLF